MKMACLDIPCIEMSLSLYQDAHQRSRSAYVVMMLDILERLLFTAAYTGNPP